MTVEQLIKKLMKYDPKAKVYVQYNCRYEFEVTSVRPMTGYGEPLDDKIVIHTEDDKWR